MYEARIVTHSSINEHKRTLILAVKAFRKVTGYGLKHSKQAVESMVGAVWNDKAPPGERLTFNGGTPFTYTNLTKVKAEQYRIEFTMHGFTVEVKKVG